MSQSHMIFFPTWSFLRAETCFIHFVALHLLRTEKMLNISDWLGSIIAWERMPQTRNFLLLSEGLLEDSHACSLKYCLWMLLLCNNRIEYFTSARDSLARKPKIHTIWPSTRKSCQSLCYCHTVQVQISILPLTV